VIPLAIPRDFSCCGKSFRQIPESLSCTISDEIESKALFCAAESKIVFSAGWICQRWCSSLLLMNRCEPSDNLGHDVEVPESTVAFSWPEECPLPDDPRAVVKRTNHIFPWVFQATVLHEMGHALMPDFSDRYQAEFACDEFASGALSQAAVEGKLPVEVPMMALTFWMCCVCSEGLNTGPWTSVTHPNPVLRTLRVLGQKVPDDHEFGAIMWFLAAVHIARLARIHGRPGANQIFEGGFRDIRGAFELLKRCW
jgi:hypothetical protein